jgi:hypothetical protein
MEKDINLTQVNPEDLAFVERELESSPRPFSLHEIGEKLAFHKTASQRVKAVLKYDPNCKYEVGDQIYKEYDESLTVSSKTVEHFQGVVVLQVVNKIYYPDFQCEMIEVEYSGGGIFRKYIDYMKKTKTQVLLPSNCDGLGQTPEKMEKSEDPRLNELPLTERDMKKLEKNLRTALVKSDQFFNWNDFWQLQKNLVAIPDDKIKAMEAQIRESGQSAFTEEAVKALFGLEASNNLFDITCLSLNTTLEKKHRKDFVFVSPIGWGKWHFKGILNSYLDDLPLAAPPAKLPEMEGTEKPQLSTFHDFPLKIYLTWREVLSGGIKVPRSLNKELSSAREYTFIDAEEGKSFTIYYFPGGCYFVGLKDFFQANNIPQGTSVTLERKGPTQFSFWLKKSKKKISVPQLSYDPKEDRFIDTGGEAFTYALPNKIIFLEKEILTQALSLFDQREEKDLHDLLVLVFKNFSLESNDHSMHFLRAYHIVDILKQTTQEEVETALLNSPEFSASEKKKGIFLYQEPRKEVEEVTAEKPAEIIEMPPLEAPPTGEAAEEEAAVVAGGEAEREEVTPEPTPVLVVPAVKPKVEAPSAARGKPARKKRGKPEGERAPRARKSERRVIEEKIELAESEMEALAAVKEQEEVPREEITAKEKKEDVKPVAPKETAFGLFAEKLKSALDKKKQHKKKEEDKE